MATSEAPQPVHILTALRSLRTPTLGDAMGGRNVIDGVARIAGVGTCAGSAYTVSMGTGDNLALHVALSRAAPGDVIVAATTEDARFGVWGGILAVAADQAGVEAVVLDSYVRDVTELRSLGVAVFARGVSIRKTAKRSPGRQQVAISIGGAVIAPGDFIVGDEDGVVVVPRREADHVIEKARSIDANEGELVEKIRRGETTLSLLGIDVGQLDSSQGRE
jgi:4-hydroxy-4-methyl-2-oxoglutarate aldolase